MSWKISSTVPRDPRENKLPKWAQQHIETLRMRLEETRDKLAGIPKADAVGFTDPYSDIPLPVAKLRDTVRFHVDAQQRVFIDVRLREDDHGRWLEVMTSDRILVTPNASNVIEIRLEDR